MVVSIVQYTEVGEQEASFYAHHRGYLGEPLLSQCHWTEDWQEPLDTLHTTSKVLKILRFSRLFGELFGQALGLGRARRQV